MPKTLSKKRTSSTAITNQESPTSSSVKIPSYNHDQSNLYTFMEELEPYLENLDSNYTMLWQRGAVGMSRTIAAMTPVHARLLLSNQLKLGFFDTPFVHDFSLYEVANPSQVSKIDDKALNETESKEVTCSWLQLVKYCQSLFADIVERMADPTEVKKYKVKSGGNGLHLLSILAPGREEDTLP